MNIAMDDTGRLYIAVWHGSDTAWTQLPLGPGRKLEDKAITHVIALWPKWAVDCYYTTPRKLAENCCDI